MPYLEAEHGVKAIAIYRTQQEVSPTVKPTRAHEYRPPAFVTMASSMSTALGVGCARSTR